MKTTLLNTTLLSSVLFYAFTKDALSAEKVAKIKVNESLKQLDKLVLGKKPIEDKVVSLMRYYELNQELDKIHSDK